MAHSIPLAPALHPASNAPRPPASPPSHTAALSTSTSSSSIPSSISATPLQAQDPLHLVVLCGLVGSGKSTFSLSLTSFFPLWVQCNQDALGSRQAVIALAHRSLLSERHVIIDRTNVDAKQRRHWLELARDLQPHLPHRHIVVSSLTFTTPIEVCEARLRRRTDHETLHSPQQAVEVLHRFCSSYSPPTLQEGFECCLTVDVDQLSPKPTEREIQKLLDRLEACEKVVRPLPDLVGGYESAASRGGRGGWGRARQQASSNRGRSALYTPHGGAHVQQGEAAGRGREGAWSRPAKRNVEYDRSSGVPPWRNPQQAHWLAPAPPRYAAYGNDPRQALSAPARASAPPPPPPPPPPPALLRTAEAPPSLY
ncbi:hypothetical protein ACQY0O_007928 [Thecaphora frezii]